MKEKVKKLLEKILECYSIEFGDDKAALGFIEKAFKEVEMEAYQTQSKADDLAIEILKLRIRQLEKTA